MARKNYNRKIGEETGLDFQDFEQELWVIYLVKPDSIVGKAQIENYLSNKLKETRNRFREHSRSIGKVKSGEWSENAAENRGHSQEELHSTWQKFMRTIPELDQLMLTYIEEGKTQAETADKLGVDQSTVSRKLLQIKADFLRWLHE